MKLKSTLEEADDARAYLRTPFYEAHGAVGMLKTVILNGFKGDNKFKCLINKVEADLNNVYKYMEKNYKGWD